MTKHTEAITEMLEDANREGLIKPKHKPAVVALLAMAAELDAADTIQASLMGQYQLAYRNLYKELSTPVEELDELGKLLRRDV